MLFEVGRKRYSYMHLLHALGLPVLGSHFIPRQKAVNETVEGVVVHAYRLRAARSGPRQIPTPTGNDNLAGYARFANASSYRVALRSQGIFVQTKPSEEEKRLRNQIVENYPELNKSQRISVLEFD